MAEYGFTTTSYVEIWSVLDILKHIKRKTLPEKPCFVAAFEKSASNSSDKNPKEIAIHQIYFDIGEMCIREARKELRAIQDSIKTDNASSMYCETVKWKMEQGKKTFFRLYCSEVIENKKEGAFERWRKEMNDLLSESTGWATTVEDCRRFINGKPLTKDYVVARYLAGDLQAERTAK